MISYQEFLERKTHTTGGFARVRAGAGSVNSVKFTVLTPVHINMWGETLPF